MNKLCTALLAIVVGCGLSLAHDAKANQKQVDLKNAKGESVGSASLKQSKDGVVINLDVKNLPAGEHALHFHQVPKCEADPAKPADAFKSAGGHFNPETKKHGLENPEGPHAGDMANFTVEADGTAKTKVTNSRVTLEEGKANSLFANGGTTLMIHAKADDLKTDPTGNAGDRIACGVVER